MRVCMTKSSGYRGNCVAIYEDKPLASKRGALSHPLRNNLFKNRISDQNRCTMKLTLIASAVADIISKAKKACIYNSFSLHKGITDEGTVAKANPDFGKLAIALKKQGAIDCDDSIYRFFHRCRNIPGAPPTR